MSEHSATISWTRDGRSFDYESYSRDHAWRFPGGAEVPASAAPAYRGSAERVDPEEAFVASVASCHMLTLLADAARQGLVIDAYQDAATGTMARNAEGRLAVTRVVLRPRITFAGPPPAADVVARLHHRAHEDCFIANSIRTEVVVSAD